MRYIALLLLIIGCTEHKDVANSLEELNNSLKSLDFSTKSLNCTMSLDREYLRYKMNRLSLPRNREVSMLLIDAEVYKCLKNKYRAED